MTCKRADCSQILIVSALVIVFLSKAHSAGAVSTPLLLPATTYSTGGQVAISSSSGAPSWLAAADVNGDGKSDIVVANWCASLKDCTTGGVGVLLNKGDGTFAPVVTYGSGGPHAFSVSVADLNHDGKADLIVALGCGDNSNVQVPCPDGSVGVLLGNGDGRFQAVHNYPAGGSPSAIAIADLNNDGRLDVVVSIRASSGQLSPSGRGSVGVLLGNADGTFQPVQVYDSGGSAAFSVRVADANGDNTPDLLVSNQVACFKCRGNVGVLFGRGDGTFQAVQTYETVFFSPVLLAATDLNGDGKPDLVPTDFPFTEPIAVMLNSGDGTFFNTVLYSSGGFNLTSVTVLDMNGDGTPDLVANYEMCNEGNVFLGCVGMLLGKGDGTFQPVVTYDTGGIGSTSLAVADFDGDGYLDVAVGHQCNARSCTSGIATAAVLAGNGDGTFRQPLVYGTDYEAVRVVVADLNGDGLPDLLVGNAGRPSLDLGSVSVLLNGGTANDTRPPKISLHATAGIVQSPRGKFLRVPIAGTITDQLSGVNLNTTAFKLTDKTGKVRQKGFVNLGRGGQYSHNIFVLATAQNPDLTGRYVVTVQAKDNAGNVGSKTTTVTVPPPD
jgi:hypothetical protein